MKKKRTGKVAATGYNVDFFKVCKSEEGKELGLYFQSKHLDGILVFKKKHIKQLLSEIEKVK